MNFAVQMKLIELIQRVEAGIQLGGVNADDARSGDEGQWLLLRNETPIYIDAWSDEQSSPWNYFLFETDRTVFQITLPFCYAPTLQREAFLEELLTVNLNLLYGKFSFNSRDNVVVLSYRVPGSSFKSEDLSAVIDGLSYYCEMAYHVLKDEFHLKRVLVEGENGNSM